MKAKVTYDTTSKVTLCKFNKEGKLNIIEAKVGGPSQSLQTWITPKPKGKGWVLVDRAALSLYPKHLKALQEQHPKVYQEVIRQFIEAESEDIPEPKIRKKPGRKPKKRMVVPEQVDLVEVD